MPISDRPALEGYDTIVTHNDFDGIVSASLCSRVLKIQKVIFTGPMAIARSQITITEKDVVCDLPYRWDEPNLVARTTASPLVFVVRAGAPWTSPACGSRRDSSRSAGSARRTATKRSTPTRSCEN